MLTDAMAALAREGYKSSTASKAIREELPPRWGRVKPADYVGQFGKLDRVTNETFFAKAFANGAATHSSPLVTRSSLTLLPGVYSFDPRVLNFQRKLADTLNRELPVDVDADGFTKSGVYTNFDRIKCPAGYFMNPMSYTSVDNSKYRTDELGLTNAMTSRQLAISTEVWRLVLGRIKVRPVNVPKLSTGGMRRFTHDAQWKLAFAEYMFEGDRFETMLNAVEADDHLTLANEFEMIFAFYIQKRGQVDMPGKERRVFDLEYARTGGAKGREFAADKFVEIDGVKYDDFSAIRARVVQAGPWVINFFLQIVATCTLYALFEEFPKVFHVNTPEQIADVTEGKHVFCSDVKEYDRSMYKQDIELPHTIMKEFWDERVVKASWKLFTAPYYSKPLSLDGRLGAWVGDPRDPSFELHGGNRSGHAFTSLIAKVNKVIDTLMIIDKQYPVLGRCRSFLEGKGVIGFVNNGDDEIVWAFNRSDLDLFKKNRMDKAAGRYLVEAEVGQGFSGQLLCRDNPSDLYYKPRAKVHTTLEKLWVPERSIGGKHRQFWTIGVIDRITNIMKTEVGRAVWDINMSLFRSELSCFGDFTSIVMREHGRLQLDLNGLSQKDREVLDDSDKLHFKYMDSEISARVLDIVTSKIPMEVTEKFVKRYFKGTII